MPNLLAVLHSMAKNRPQRTVLVSPSAPAPIRTLKCDISPRSHGNGMTMSRERTDTPIPTLHLPATPHHEGVLPPAVCANRNTRMLFCQQSRSVSEIGPFATVPPKQAAGCKRRYPPIFSLIDASGSLNDREK